MGRDQISGKGGGEGRKKGRGLCTCGQEVGSGGGGRGLAYVRQELGMWEGGWQERGGGGDSHVTELTKVAGSLGETYGRRVYGMVLIWHPIKSDTCEEPLVR